MRTGTIRPPGIRRWPRCRACWTGWKGSSAARTVTSARPRRWRPPPRCAPRTGTRPPPRPHFARGRLPCPAGVSMPFEPGTTVPFPKDTCAPCPLRQRCTASPAGRSVAIHPDEALLAELRQRQATPAGRAKLRERVQVEHTLAHVGHWQGRRARYRGTRKNLFDLRRVAVVHNLHVIARHPPADGYELAS